MVNTETYKSNLSQLERDKITIANKNIQSIDISQTDLNNTIIAKKHQWFTKDKYKELQEATVKLNSILYLYPNSIDTPIYTWYVTKDYAITNVMINNISWIQNIGTSYFINNNKYSFKIIIIPTNNPTITFNYGYFHHEELYEDEHRFLFLTDGVPHIVNVDIFRLANSSTTAYYPFVYD